MARPPFRLFTDPATQAEVRAIGIIAFHVFLMAVLILFVLWLGGAL